MARVFPLSGLLRLRQLQQDQAASELAAANARLRESRVRRDRARGALGATSADATSVEALYALAAARASTRSMLADLDALGRHHETGVQQAQAAFDLARASAVGLEKLAARHAEEAAREERHEEQVVLDEIASTGWHRDQEAGR
ncbi:flagellar FliJ family protein [Cryobacterium tepidiphilum]|uniref:Flagellar FliJ protein n=1 Tax=Cryobacterium tepidiphilum TaxID=2486026 RepID=A0A3M8LQB8_9MICO|nr:flagellar FliJ family protein [Cryobacterium tepidiphilum]RNE66678.1 hypothetical protein EEJ31_02490 [Cryobacterium tepidiphilum]